MSGNAESEAQCGVPMGMKGLAGSVLRCRRKVSGQLQERRAGCRKFQILGDATEKLRAPNAVHANETVSRLVLEDLRERVEV